MLYGDENRKLINNSGGAGYVADDIDDPASPTTGLIVNIERMLHIRAAVKSYNAMSKAQVAFVSLLVLLVIAGNCGQLITLNFWIQNFARHQQPRPFTILTLSATTIASFFTVALLGRIMTKRVRLNFLFTPKGIGLTLIVGFCNATNGIFLVSASGPTPEVLQALLLSSQVFWTLIFCAVILREGRSYVNVLVAVSFLFSAGGIILGASPSFAGEKFTRDAKLWSLIFAFSMIPGALYNVFASIYMRLFTIRPDHPEDVDDVFRADDVTVKLTMLCTTGFSQIFWMFVFLPLDSAPWFGTSPNLAASRAALTAGWECVFKHGVCEGNYIYYLLFNVSYFLNYVGSSYLNHYSAGLNAMVTQLSSPIGAIILIIAPAWNVDETPYAAGPAVGGAILLIIGTLIYTVWENGSREQLARSKRNLGETVA